MVRWYEINFRNGTMARWHESLEISVWGIDYGNLVDWSKESGKENGSSQNKSKMNFLKVGFSRLFFVPLHHIQHVMQRLRNQENALFDFLYYV